MILSVIPSTKAYKSAQTFFVVFLHKHPPVSSISNNQDGEIEHKTPISNSFIFFIVKTKAVLLLFIGLNNTLEAKQTDQSMLFINKNAFLFPKAQIFEAHPH